MLSQHFAIIRKAIIEVCSVPERSHSRRSVCQWLAPKAGKAERVAGKHAKGDGNPETRSAILDDPGPGPRVTGVISVGLAAKPNKPGFVESGRNESAKGKHSRDRPNERGGVA